MLIVNPSNIKPPLWAINPGLVWHNAQKMGLPMPRALWGTWGSGDECSDLAGSQLTGMLSAAGVEWQNNGLYFSGLDGDDGIVSFGQILDITTHITLVALVNVPDNPDPQNNGGRIISKTSGTTGDHWALFLGSTRTVWFRASGGQAETLESVPVGQDTLVAGVYNGASLKIYIGGEVKATTVESGPLSTGTNVGLGRNPGTIAGRQLAGFIKMAAAFDVPLVQTQVATLSADPYGLVQQPKRIWAVEATAGVISRDIAGALPAMAGALARKHYAKRPIQGAI